MRTMQGPHASVARHVPAFKRDGLPRSRIATGPDLARPSTPARFSFSFVSVLNLPVNLQQFSKYRKFIND
jgi:hypothetical protein